MDDIVPGREFEKMRIVDESGDFHAGRGFDGSYLPEDAIDGLSLFPENVDDHQNVDIFLDMVGELPEDDRAGIVAA